MPNLNIGKLYIDGLAFNFIPRARQPEQKRNFPDPLAADNSRRRRGIFMYLKIAYGWFAEENRGKTADLDKALQDCLDDFGFFQTKARFDMANGERCLEFESEESIIRDVLSCPHCGKKNPQYFKTCWKCKKDLGSENL